MQHLSLCADSYRAASNREQRRIVLTNLFISCDHSGVSQPSKVFRLPGILQIDLYPLVQSSPQKSFTIGLLIEKKKAKLEISNKLKLFFFFYGILYRTVIYHIWFFFNFLIFSSMLMLFVYKQVHFWSFRLGCQTDTEFSVFLRHFGIQLKRTSRRMYETLADVSQLSLIKVLILHIEKNSHTTIIKVHMYVKFYNIIKSKS